MTATVGADVERYEVARPLDLQLAVLRAQRSALLRGANDLERSVVATIVSELGSNVLKYAGRGTVELRRLRPAEGAGVEVVVRDQGPGIADLALALTDHYSSGRTLGLGLPGVQRMADAFQVEATVGGGTTVRVRKRWSSPFGDVPTPTLEGPVRPLVGAGARWSAAARVRARYGHPHAGDLAAIVDRGDRVAFGIVDAAGHGAGAHALAHALVHRLHERFATTADPDDVAALLHELHERCAGTRGAAAGIAVLDPAAGTLRYLAVGNVRAAVVGARRFTGVSRDGLLGRRWPTPFVQRATLAPDDLVLLWTDGLPSTLAHALEPGGGDRAARALAPADLAEHLLAEHAKTHDDAACLAVRWRP